MTSYASLDDYKDTHGITDTAGDDAIQRALDAATEWIDGHCGRSFGRQPVTATKEFYAASDSELLLPDLVSATTVKLDTNGDGTFESTLDPLKDFEILPLSPALGGPGTLLRLRPLSVYVLSPIRRVQVAGTWGYGSLPKSVVQACLILAARYFLRKDAPFGIMQSAEMGTFARLPAQDPDVVQLLARYVSKAGADSWVVV